MKSWFIRSWFMAAAILAFTGGLAHPFPGGVLI